jgi:Domain of Unknown Function with PDB structure (DUF3857)/Transglutaminase-like superfamily
VKHSIRRACLVCSAAFLVTAPLFGSVKWIQASPDEMKMTSDPKAPDAPAVYLNYDEYVDIKAHFHRVYARIKILTERGKEEYSDVEIPFETGATAIRGIDGRTIEPDGTVVPFTGTPIDKEVVKLGHIKMMEKVFSMPNVQVGSIIEYQWERQYDDWYVFPPSWDLQKPIFMHDGHYHFNAIQLDPGSSMTIAVPDGMGHVLTANRLLYDQQLPPGSTLKDLPTGFDLVVKDVQPIPEEPWSPPLDSFSYRLIFYYSAQYTGQEFWTSEGRTWAKDVDHFAATSDRIRQAVGQIVGPGDNDDQKARKIFAAVMTVDNTAYSRSHTEEENKAEGAKEKTAADIWDQKRGTPVEIARLFTAMARTAGLKVSEMALTRRDERILNASYLYWGQMNNEIAIVTIDGKDVFLDPGERYCEYGKLAWEHTQVMGIRETDSGTQPVLTPAADYKDTVLERKAVLQLAQDGKVEGSIQYSMTGAEALRWRHVALRKDGEQAAKEFNEDLQQKLPAGIQVKTDHLDNLTDSTQPLTATVQVTGSMGTATGNRIFLPGTFFAGSEKPLFAEGKRENPVDLHYPSATRDQVKISLAPGLKVNTVPADAQIPFPQNAQYVAKYAGSGNTYQQVRLLAVGNTVYSKDEYPKLRDFFQKAGAQDQQQVVLERQAASEPSGQ